MDDAKLFALLEQLGITPEELDQLSEAGTFDESSALYGEEAARADAMRNAPMPQGRQVGRLFVASSPLESLATALQRMKGEKDYQGAMGQRRTLLDTLRKGNRTAGIMGARANMPPQMQQPIGPIPADQAPQMVQEDPGSVLARILRQLESGQGL